MDKGFTITERNICVENLFKVSAGLNAFPSVGSGIYTTFGDRILILEQLQDRSLETGQDTLNIGILKSFTKV